MNWIIEFFRFIQLIFPIPTLSPFHTLLGNNKCWFQVSIIAKQHGRQLVEYRTEAGDNLEILHFGDLSPKVRELLISYRFYTNKGIRLHSLSATFYKYLGLCSLCVQNNEIDDVYLHSIVKSGHC